MRTPITDEDIEAFCDNVRDKFPTRASKARAVGQASYVLREYQRFADMENMKEKHS